MGQISIEILLSIIGILLGIIIPIIVFFLNRNLKRRALYKKYYSIKWKKSSSLSPEDFIGGRPYEKFYFERNEDAQISQYIQEGHNVLIVGRPLSGKSRAMYELIRNLKTPIDIIMPNCVNIARQDFVIPKHITFWRSKLLILDDFHTFVDCDDFKYLIDLFTYNSINIIAACRSGGDFNKVKEKFTDAKSSLHKYFGDYTVHIKKISSDDAQSICKEVNKNWDDLKKLFNGKGTVGSIFLELPVMKTRFNQCNKDEKIILRCFKKLYDCGIYEGFRMYPYNWVETITKSNGINKGELIHWLGELENKEFLEYVKDDDTIIIDEAYLEIIITCARLITGDDLYKEIFEIFSTQVSPLLKLVRRLYTLKNYEGSIFYCDKILEIDPNNIRALTSKGTALGILERYEEALEYFNKVLEIDPNNILVLTSKGTALDILEKHEEALEYLDKALEIDPNYIYALIYKAIVLYTIERYEEALEYYDKALEIDPNDIHALTSKGTALGLLERHLEALEYYDRALEIDPNNIPALTSKGTALGILEKHEEALEYFDKVLEIDPNKILVLTSKGTALGILERHEEALEYYDKALEIDPNNILVLTSKGTVLDILERHEEALEYYDKALEIDPNNILVLTSKGTALYTIERYEEALEYLDKVLEIEPNFASVWYNKACLESSRNNKEKSIRFLKRAIELDNKWKEEAKEDHEFDNIRNTPEFKELIKE